MFDHSIILRARSVRTGRIVSPYSNIYSVASYMIIQKVILKPEKTM